MEVELAGIWEHFIHRYVSFNKKKRRFLIESFSCYTAPPTYAESQYRANIVDKNDTQHTVFASGQTEFAPRYPTYAGTMLPALPKK